MMSAQQRLLDEWSVRKVIERYCRLLDDQRYDALAELFAEDSTFFTMGKELKGKADLVAFLGRGEAVAPSRPTAIHVLSNCIVEIDGAAATAETDWVMLRRERDGTTIIELAGRYRDRLRRHGETWLFTERRAVAMARPRED